VSVAFWFCGQELHKNMTVACFPLNSYYKIWKIY